MYVNRMPHMIGRNIIQVTGMLLELKEIELLDLLFPKDLATGAAALLEKAPLVLPATSSQSLRHLPAISTLMHGVSARSRNICCAVRRSRTFA